MFDADGVRHLKRALGKDAAIERAKVVKQAFSDIQRRTRTAGEASEWSRLNADYLAIQSEARVLDRDAAKEVESRFRRYFGY